MAILVDFNRIFINSKIYISIWEQATAFCNITNKKFNANHWVSQTVIELTSEYRFQFNSWLTKYAIQQESIVDMLMRIKNIGQWGQDSSLAIRVGNPVINAQTVIYILKIGNG